jgi:hypothetical protein
MSSKKNLLNEATVRRFMKLANMEALGDNFVSSTVTESSCGEMREEEEMEEGYGKKEEMEEMMDYAREDEEEMDLEDVVDVELPIWKAK